MHKLQTIPCTTTRFNFDIFIKSNIIEYFYPKPVLTIGIATETAYNNPIFKYCKKKDCERERAEMIWNNYDEIPLEAIILYRRALEMSTLGNHKTALTYLGHALIIAPHFTVALNEMGNCYDKLGRHEEAIAKYDKVLQIDPFHAEALFNKSRILNKIGRDE